MSTTIQEKEDVTITQFATGQGIGFQVTWKSSDPEHFFDYVHFDNLFDATKFAELLENRLVR